MVQFHVVTVFSFNFPLHFLKFSLASHYVACSFLPFSLLDVPSGVKRAIGFPQMFGLIPVAHKTIIKLNTNNIFHVVRFDSDVVNFDFPSNFFKSLLATHYNSYSFFLT